MKEIVKVDITEIELYSDNTRAYVKDIKYKPGIYYPEHCGFYTHTTKSHHYFIADYIYEKDMKWSNVYNTNHEVCVINFPDILDENDDPRINGLLATKILSKQSGNIAALYCINLTVDGCNDWFLPSVYELNDILKNRDKFNENCQNREDQLVGFYWSSTEYNYNAAWILPMYTNKFERVYKNKNSIDVVRPVRKIPV